MPAAASRFTSIVRRIPTGKVATYGQIAAMAGRPRNARQVGAVLRNLPDNSTVPWHRAVNSQGRISERGSATFEGLQRHLLKCEGVIFAKNGRINLATFQWRPRSAKR